MGCTVHNNIAVIVTNKYVTLQWFLALYFYQIKAVTEIERQQQFCCCDNLHCAVMEFEFSKGTFR
jgi:hypothetical protein